MAIDMLQNWAGNGAAIVFALGGLRWAFARIDRYQDRMEKRLKQVEMDGERCRLRSMALLSAYHLTAEALRRHDPRAPELDAADRILGKAFKVDVEVPPGFTELLDKLK